MTSKSKVFAIGTESCAIIEETPIRKSKKAYFEDHLEHHLEQHLQKLLLDGARPLTTVYLDKSVETFSAKDIKKNGRYYYEFGPGDKINGWMINGPAFEPKGILSRVKEKISKDHWVTDNVARYSKDSRDFILQTVSKSLDEESADIYQYLSYLNDNCNNT
ncbi:uncharacterized protein [Drosophila kikkawai]|uniref:Uncharacterized protein n=1 Tax=Drosophila kikkawai TaxID=30033 RepID=A0A6P4HTG9_DROKI|nr:uncharacterized protein LOC108072321 [Drosophila kikkawai]